MVRANASAAVKVNDVRRGCATTNNVFTQHSLALLRGSCGTRTDTTGPCERCRCAHAHSNGRTWRSQVCTSGPGPPRVRGTQHAHVAKSRSMPTLILKLCLLVIEGDRIRSAGRDDRIDWRGVLRRYPQTIRFGRGILDSAFRVSGSSRFAKAAGAACMTSPRAGRPFMFGVRGGNDGEASGWQRSRPDGTGAAAGTFPLQRLRPPPMIRIGAAPGIGSSADATGGASLR